MMVTGIFSGLKGIVWDLDNTLYRLDAAVEQAMNLAIAKAALDWGVDMSLHDAMALAHQSYRDHRYSGYEFMIRYGITQHEIHHLTDKFLDDETIIQKSEETRDLFAESDQRHALITHSARPWALRVLKRLELDLWFPDSQVFAFENYEFESKAKSRRSFDMALQSIGADAAQAMMVEDTLENLRIPKEMGMRTVYLHHGRPVDDLPGFVDYHTANVIDLLTTIQGGRVYSSASG